MEDTRQSTKASLDGVSDAVVAWVPPDGSSSIGTVLYHIALIEADWLYVEVLEQEYAPAIAARFPHAPRDADDQLVQVQGGTLTDHLVRLDAVREQLLQVFQAMEVDDFRRLRHLAEYEVTPEWVLHHLMQHEAEHRSQLGALRARAELELA